MTEIPQIPKKCKICHDENKFLIQKAIDDGVPITVIEQKYNVLRSTINTHINNDHRTNLIALGTMDYVVRKKAIDTGIILSQYIEKWANAIPERLAETIRDNDAMKALELFSKIEGTLINKHEVTVKRSIETALAEFLAEDEEIVEDNNEIKKE